MLTEAKLRKMPKSKYMNKEQLEFFQQLLLKMKKEIEENIDRFRKELADLQPAADENDQASLEEERLIKVRIIERQSKVIPKINYSLQQIQEGIYGYCEETGEPIGIERLLVRPTATLSITSKNVDEQKEKFFRDNG
jgi:DnaK suppressor protein